MSSTTTVKRKHGHSKATVTDRPAQHTSESEETRDLKTQKTLLRRCLPHVKYLVAIILIPPFLNYVALLQESAQLVPSGALYDVGFGQKMYLGCNGTGSPTVIFDAGLGSSSDSWLLVYQEISKFTRACLYDRAGLGFSSRPYQNNSRETEAERRDRWKLYTAERMVDDLHTLVTYSSQQPRPFLFVATEMGSLVARFYTQLYESDVAGLILINPLPEDLFSYDSHVWADYWWHNLVPKLQAMQLWAALGFTRLALLLGMHEIPLANYSVSSSELINRQAWEKAQQNLVSTLHPNSERIVVADADRSSVSWQHHDVIVKQIQRFIQGYRTRHRHH